MGIMIIPYVSSLSEDAMRAVPMACAKARTRWGRRASRRRSAWSCPAAFSGIAAAYILGISRAVGETMILAVAAGMQPNLTLNPLEPAATITAYIVQVALGDLPHGSIGYQSIFAAGLTLMLMTLVLQHARPLCCASASGRRTDDAPPSHRLARRPEIRELIAPAQALGRACSASLGVLALMIGVLTLRRAVRRHG